MTEEKRGPGRPKKNVESPEDAAAQAVEELTAEKPYAKQFSRTISRTGRYVEDAWPVDAVDAYINVWRNNGYKLFAAFPWDRNEYGPAIMYIMILDE